MAKRFTDTNKYKKPFIRGLQGAYKIFWDYLYHDCDHAGIWIVDFDIAQIYVGFDMPINKDDALECFNKDEVRIISFSNNTKWFIPSFVEFQYGELNPTNRAHNSVINLLKKNDLFKHLISPLKGSIDKDKDMDKDIYSLFNKFVEEIKRGEHTQAIEQMYMRLKIKKGSMTHLLEDFKGQLLIDNKLHKNTLELRKHLNNWLNKQETAGKLKEYKLHKSL